MLRLLEDVSSLATTCRIDTTALSIFAEVMQFCSWDSETCVNHKACLWWRACSIAYYRLLYLCCYTNTWDSLKTTQSYLFRNSLSSVWRVVSVYQPYRTFPLKQHNPTEKMNNMQSPETRIWHQVCNCSYLQPFIMTEIKSQSSD